MPSVLLILSRLGACLALAGSAPGVYRWGRLNTAQRLTTAFLWVSGISGLLGWILRAYHMANPIIGNLWDLAIAGLLFPALICCVDDPYREPFKPVQLMAVIVWLVWFGYWWNIDHFTTWYHFSLCLAILTACGAIFHRFAWEPSGVWKSPAFILAVACTIGFLSDVIPFSASHDWLALNQAPQRALWAFRNGSWCVAYLLMALSTLRDGEDGL